MADQYEARVSSNGTLGAADQDFLNSNENFDDLDDDFLDIYNLTWKQRIIHHGKRNLKLVREKFTSLSYRNKLLVVSFAVLQVCLVVVLILKREALLKGLVDISNDLNAKWYTPVVLILLIILVSFPPLIGYSVLSMSIGLIYGVSFKGWLILAFASVTGAVVSFVTFKTMLHSQAESLIRWNSKFEALSSVLQENNSYWIIALIRLCPFPYSFTNGALAAVYGITVKNFVIANILTTPKAFFYLFIGSSLKNMGETDSGSTRFYNLMSILFTDVLLILTAWVLYYRIKKRYLELQREQQNSFDVF